MNIKPNAKKDLKMECPPLIKIWPFYFPFPFNFYSPRAMPSNLNFMNPITLGNFPQPFILLSLTGHCFELCSKSRASTGFSRTQQSNSSHSILPSTTCSNKKHMGEIMELSACSEHSILKYPKLSLFSINAWDGNKEHSQYFEYSVLRSCKLLIQTR